VRQVVQYRPKMPGFEIFVLEKYRDLETWVKAYSMSESDTVRWDV